MSWLRRLLGRLEVLLVLAWLMGGCATAQLASRVPAAAACHKAASADIQMSPTCAEAQKLVDAEPDCQSAYPGGLDLKCSEVKP